MKTRIISSLTVALITALALFAAAAPALQPGL